MATLSRENGHDKALIFEGALFSDKPMRKLLETGNPYCELSFMSCSHLVHLVFSAGQGAGG